MAEQEGRAPTVEVDGGMCQMYDPACDYFDARLSPKGEAQVVQLAVEAAALSPQPEVVLCSPLTRALETATGGFAGGVAAGSLKMVVEPLLTEKLENSGDVGSGASQQRVAFPDVSGWEDVPEVWWYTSKGAPTADGAQFRTFFRQHRFVEPDDTFRARVDALRQRLIARPERCVALVGHHDTFRALARALQPDREALSMDNCQVVTLKLC